VFAATVESGSSNRGRRVVRKARRLTDRNLASVGEALLDAFAWPGNPDSEQEIQVRQGAGPGPLVGVLATVADPNSGEQRIVHISEQFAERLGYTSEVLLGAAYGVLLSQEISPREQQIIDHVAVDGESVELPQVFLRSDGRTILLHATYATLPQLEVAPSYRLVQFRDPSADGSAATSRGEFGAGAADLASLCGNVATDVLDRLGGTGECWIGATDSRGELEVLAPGETETVLVRAVLQVLMSTGDPTGPRCVLVEHLDQDLRALMAEAGFYALWAFPAADSTGRQRGALVVAHRFQELPGDDDVRLFDHLSQVLAAGIERAGVEARIAHQALHDPLTRLPNRALIVDRLSQALARMDREPTTLSVLLVDVDRFKSINESRGVEVGDQVLVEVARRLLGTVRVGDTVGRISADQFLMVCVSNADLDVSTVARRVIDVMGEPIEIEGEDSIHITASVGAVAVDDSSLTPPEVIGNAESALARAVANGRGRYVLFDEKHQSRDLVRHELEQALHRAIVENELVVYYQPVAETRSGLMIGAEALIRWERPGHGLLSPAAFIEVAEESGLIVPMGAWVINQVARDLADWPRSDGWSPVVTVNLSARQLADPSLVPLVHEVLARHQLPPVRLGFEVTESMRIDDFEQAIDSLNQLADMGCRIAVDDFGIGHATLDYLRRFSMAHVLKIDRSFVAGLGREREDTAIVDASMALARSLQLNVVAEGVEESYQIAQLAKLGCHFVQGYALSKPVPYDEITKLWQRRQLFDPVWPTPPKLDLSRDASDRRPVPAPAPRPSRGTMVG